MELSVAGMWTWGEIDTFEQEKSHLSRRCTSVIMLERVDSPVDFPTLTESTALTSSSSELQLHHYFVQLQQILDEILGISRLRLNWNDPNCVYRPSFIWQQDWVEPWMKGIVCEGKVKCQRSFPRRDRKRQICRQKGTRAPIKRNPKNFKFLR